MNAVDVAATVAVISLLWAQLRIVQQHERVKVHEQYETQRDLARVNFV